MNASLSLSSIITPTKKFLGKYNATLFFTAILLLLAGAILALYLTVQNPTAPAGEDETISSTFDKQTAEKVKQLRDSNESSRDLVYPTPRSNPFVE